MWSESGTFASILLLRRKSSAVSTKLINCSGCNSSLPFCCLGRFVQIGVASHVIPALTKAGMVVVEREEVANVLMRLVSDQNISGMLKSGNKSTGPGTLIDNLGRSICIKQSEGGVRRPFDLRDDYEGLDGGIENLLFSAAGNLGPVPGTREWQILASMFTT